MDMQAEIITALRATTGNMVALWEILRHTDPKLAGLILANIEANERTLAKTTAITRA
jgi:hypothetical protein